MTGNDGNGIIIQERDRHLLAELGTMRIIDRETARKVAPFGSVTRANTRLLALVRAGLLRRFFVGTAAGGKKALYALSPSGARLAGATSLGPKRGRDELVVADFFVTHELHVNELFCDFKCGAGLPADLQFRRWLAFASPLDEAVPLVPDGYVECGSLTAFVEVDLGHERHAVWRAKVQNYLNYAISGRFEDRFAAKRFLVLAVADTTGRMEALRGTTAKLTDKVFRFTTFEAIRGAGVRAQIWRKPQGNEMVSLISTP